MKLSLIVATDFNRLIGRGNAMPWHLPADLAHFKRVTMGRPVIMGRRTFESIGRPLPGRTNIVLSRDPAFAAEGCIVVRGLDEAIARAGDIDEVFVIGGAMLYEEALPRADRLYLTIVEHEFEGDAWFPDWRSEEWREVARERREPDEKNPWPMTFLTLERGVVEG